MKLYLRFLLTAYFSFALISLYAQNEGDGTGSYDAQMDFNGFGYMGSAGLSPLDSNNVFSMPVGLVQIDDQQYIGLRIQPELAFGKIGFGLDIPLLFNIEDGKLRTDEFKDGVGILRMVRYLRYGVKKRDKVYARVGDLSGSYIGYGALLNNYTNSPSFEKRKVGLTLDINPIPYAGIEGLYSDFSTSSLLAVRPYVRPLATSGIPVLKNVELGFTYARDKDQNTFLVNEGLNAWGVDLGVGIIQSRILNLRAFTQYSKINKVDSDTLSQAIDALALADPEKAPHLQGYDDGDGFSIGLDALFNLGGTFYLGGRIERLWYSDYYLPQFFNSTYEINKDARLLSLASARSIQGIYGSISGKVADKISITGGLLLPDYVSEENPAFVHVSAQATEAIPNVILQANYIKGDLSNLKDAFKLDERSLLTARVAYRIGGIFMIGTDYRWTYARVENENGQEEVKATSYVMPFVGLHIPLNFGQNTSRP